MSNLSWSRIQNLRNEMLSRSDWTQLPDVQLSDEEKQKWSVYRQSLRDITKNFPTPAHVDWPVPPDLEKINNES